jgi:hypothetical protein
MTNKKTTPAPATKTDTEADKNASNTAARDRVMSREELEKVTGGINPQPLPPRHD